MEDKLAPMHHQHLLNLSTAMNKLRQDGHLTDVTLVCGEEKFPANKIVLAANSTFFAGKFAGDASDQELVELQHIPTEIMKVLLDFMYTGTISVDVTDIPTLILLVTVASELKLLSLVEYCLKYVLHSLSFSYVVQLMKMFDEMKNAELKAQVMKHLGQKIKSACDADLRELPLNCFREILSSKDGHFEPDDALRAIITWVDLDIEQRSKDLKILLELLDKKGLSDNCLFEIQKMAWISKCPDLVMFTLGIMTSRYQAVSSLHGSSWSLLSESSECNDNAKEESEDSTLEKEKTVVKLADSKETTGILMKAAAALGKDGDLLPPIKEESSIPSERKLETLPVSLKSDPKKGNDSYDNAEIQKEPTVTDAVPTPTHKLIPISTSPPVKDTSPVSTPPPVNNMKLANGSEIEKALEITPILVKPYLAPARSTAIHSPVPCEMVNKTKHCDATKPKEVTGKTQRTVANLSLLSVGKKQPSNALRQPNTGGPPAPPNLSKGPPTDRGYRLDGERTQYDTNRSHFADRNRCSDDLFGRCSAAIRNHEANRTYGPNRSFDRGHNYDRNSREPFHTRDHIRTHETFRSQESSVQQDANRRRDGSKCNDMPVTPSSVTENSNQPVASKNRLPVTVASSQQVESSKNVFFVLQKANEWSLEVFSTETDEWASPKPISKEVYRHSTVVSVGHVIYFMGGTTDTWDVLKTVLMYNIRTNEWRSVAEMQVARWAAGGAQLQAYIYIVGGVSEVNTRLNHVERYNPLSDKWSTIAPLSTCREQPSVTSVNDKLYVIGGYVILPQQWQMRTIETKSTASGEVYNPLVDQWTELVTPLSIGRDVPDKTFCTTALNDRLFAIRGRTPSGELPNDTPVLFEYDLTAKQWYRHAISDPELMTVTHICSMTDEQLCLVSGMGNVYVFQSIDGGKKELLKCCDGEKQGLLYAVVPCASK